MQAILFAFLAVVTWVLFNLLLRVAADTVPVALVGTFSRIVTLPLLAAWVLATGARWRRLVPRGTGGWLALMGAVSIAVNLLWFGAMTWTSATNVAMLFRLDLVFVVLIGALLGLERIGWPQLLLVPTMLLGLALLSEVHRLDFAGHMAGDLMIVVAAFGFAVNAFVIRRILMGSAATANRAEGRAQTAQKSQRKTPRKMDE